MASLGNILRSLGYAELGAFGTAESQREQAFRERQLSEQVAWRQQQAEESKRLHELQYGFATPEELSFYEPIFKDLGVPLPPGGRIRRSDIPRVMEGAARAHAQQ